MTPTDCIVGPLNTAVSEEHWLSVTVATCRRYFWGSGRTVLGEERLNELCAGCAMEVGEPLVTRTASKEPRP